MNEVPFGVDTFPQDPQPRRPLTPGEQAIVDADARRADAEQAARDREFAASFRLAVQSDPLIEAQALEVAQRLGVPEELVRKDVRVARETMRAAEVASAEFRAKYPIFRETLSEPAFARLTHQDLFPLQRLEDSSSYLGRQWAAGGFQNELGRIGSKQILGIDTAEDRDRADELQLLLERAQKEAGFFGKVTMTLGQMVGTAGVAVAAGATAGGVASVAGPFSAGGTFATVTTASLFGLSSQVEAGLQYRRMLAMGYTPAEAKSASVAYGLAAGAMEAYGFRYLARPFVSAVAPAARGFGAMTAGAGVGRFLKQWAKGAAAEAGVEGLQEVAAVVAEAAVRPEWMRDPTVAENIGRVADATWEALKVMGAIALPGPTLNFITDLHRVERSKQQQRYLSDAVASVKETTVAKNAPGPIEAYIAKTIEGTDAKTAHIDTEELVEILRQSDSEAENAGEVREKAIDSLNKLVPGIKEKVEQAQANGDDFVEVPTEQLVTRVLPTEAIGDAILQVTTFNPDIPTAKAAAAIQASIPEMAKKAVTELEQRGEDVKKFEESAREVEAEMRVGGIETFRTATAKIGRGEVERVARLYREFVTVQAVEDGVLPMDWHRKNGVKVQYSATGVPKREGAVAQTDFESPEFKAWFGDSKVVDGAGKPATMFHGTARAFEAFDRKRANDAEGRKRSMGWGAGKFYFASSGEAASSSAEFARITGRGKAPQVMPVYLSVQNPIASDAYMERVNAAVASGATRDAAIASVDKQLQAEGVDGISDATSGGIAVFRPEQIKSVNNRGTFDPNDPNILRQDGEKTLGGYARLERLILLGPDSNFSTVVHELSHFFLDALLRSVTDQITALKDQATAPTRMQADVLALLDWWGIGSSKQTLAERLALWNGKTFDEQEKYHERFAARWEQFLYDGKAPTIELEGLFARVAAFMRRVYSAVREQFLATIAARYERDFKEPLPELNEDIIGVMGRMVAAADAIEHAERVRSLTPMFREKPADMDDAKWAAYQKDVQRARDEALATLTADSVRAMKWAGRARSKVLKNLQAEHDEARRKVRAEVAAEVMASPIERARVYLVTGKATGPDGTTVQEDADANHKLDAEAVNEIEAGAAEKLAKFVRKDGTGLSPDTVAQAFDLGTGKDLVRALLETPPAGKQIDQITDARMLTEHGDLVPGTTEFDDAVARAIHNEARLRFVAAELRHLSGATRPTNVVLAAAKAVARQRLAETAVRDLRADKFAQQAAKAARDVQENLTPRSERKPSKTKEGQKEGPAAPAFAGDSAAAALAKQRELLFTVMARMAGDARAEVDSAVASLKEKYAKPDSKIGKTRNVDLVALGRALMAAFTIGAGKRMPLEYVELARRYNPTFYEERIAPIFARMTGGNTLQDYRDLTLDEFRDLAAVLEDIWEQSKTENQITVLGEQRLLDVAATEGAAQIEKTIGPADPNAVPRPLTDKELKWYEFGSLTAALSHMEQWAIRMDGGQPGIVHTLLFSILREPFNAYQIEKDQIIREISDRLHKLPGMDRPAVKADQEGELNGYAFTMPQLMAAIMNSGNESNLRALMVGMKWVRKPEKASDPIDTRGWWRFLGRMMTEGVITKEHMAFAQFVWDQFETRKARMQATHLAAYGFRMNEVVAREIVTPFGVYKGGYYPLKYDATIDREAREWTVDELQGVLDEARQSIPSTGRGMTKDRVEGVVKPVLLDIRPLGYFFDQHLRFLHLQKAGLDLLKLLRNERLAGAIDRAGPHLMRQMILPWMQATMQNRVMEGGMDSMTTRLFVNLRRNTGVLHMFANIPNSLQQLTGFASALQMVKLKWMRASATKWAADRKGYLANILRQSSFMSLRLEHQIGQIVDDIDIITKPGWLGDAQRWTRKHAYFMQRFFQNPVDIITWGAAFEQARAGGATEADAVRSADATVRRTQGSGTAADISKWERGAPAVRLLTQFATFWVAQTNILMQKRGAERATALAMIVLFQGLLAATIATALEGGWGDDDEDGAVWDDVVKWGLGESFKATASATVPFAGSALSRLLLGESRGRLDMGAVWGTLGSLDVIPEVVAIATDDTGKKFFRGSQVRDVASLLTLGLAVPVAAVGRTGGYLFDVARGFAAPENAYQAASGAITGRYDRVR